MSGFENGKRYKFTRDKFIDDMGRVTHIDTGWVNRINGMEVEVVSPDRAYADDVKYIVLPEWCEEITGS